MRGVAARWYAFAAVGVPLAAIAATAVLFGAPRTGASQPWALAAGYLLHLGVVLITVNLAEEVAWMGFVQRSLQERHGPLKAAAATGVVFGLGHVSQVIGESATATMSRLVLLIAVSIPFRALLAWVANRTDSLFLVAMVHAATNAVAAGSILGTGLLDRLYPGAGAGGLVIPLMAVVGLVVVVATRGRLGHSKVAGATSSVR